MMNGCLAELVCNILGPTWLASGVSLLSGSLCCNGFHLKLRDPHDAASNLQAKSTRRRDAAVGWLLVAYLSDDLEILIAIADPAKEDAARHV